MNLQEIKECLKQYKIEIIERLVSKKWQSFKYYFYINENYQKNNINDEFKKEFCKFYIMNAPTGLNNQQKEEFFNLMKLRESDLKNILLKLYKIAGFRNRNSLLLSFGSKLLHTLNNDLPIYDKNISIVLCLPKQLYSKSFEEMLNNRLFIYEELKNNFKLLLKNVQIIECIADIRQDLIKRAQEDNFKWENDLISDTKLLDFMLWALYSVKNE
ncbi:hypothetical protein EOL99_02830 [Candidatus Falkowbacteria bacterium]|nr:hypothetical protein [Candidatus Falkowbacteria bacterium]